MCALASGEWVLQEKMAWNSARLSPPCHWSGNHNDLCERSVTGKTRVGVRSVLCQDRTFCIFQSRGGQAASRSKAHAWNRIWRVKQPGGTHSGGSLRPPAVSPAQGTSTAEFPLPISLPRSLQWQRAKFNLNGDNEQIRTTSQFSQAWSRRPVLGTELTYKFSYSEKNDHIENIMLSILAWNQARVFDSTIQAESTFQMTPGFKIFLWYV